MAQPTIPTIHIARLTLRGFTLADAEPLFRITNEPDMMQYFPNPNPPDRERVERLIVRQLEHWQSHRYGWWAVAWPADGCLLGWCGLQYLPETDEVEVGYLLERPVWGQGLATEAATATVNFGFSHFPLQELIGITHPANLASQRVLEKAGLGFTQATRYFTMACYRFAISRAEWERTRARMHMSGKERLNS